MSAMAQRLRDESGHALAIALGVLMVTSVLTASVFAVATHVSSTSNTSRDSKRALAAADAGLDAAVYRMNKQNVQSPSECFTTQLVAEVSGECPAQSGSLGNGASYSYHVTPVLESGETCAGVPVSYAGPVALSIAQRCVTASGTAAGVTRRIQARVASYVGLQLFSVGIMGLERVEMKNTSQVNSVAGSNGDVVIGNSNTITGFELGPSASPVTQEAGGTNTVGFTTRRTVAEGNHVLAPVDVGDSATENDNARLLGSELGLVGGARDAMSNVTYNHLTRVVTMGDATGGSSSLTLGGGTYNFCKFAASGRATLNIAVGAKVRIFIDSPDRGGSGCAAGTGTLTAANAFTINNPGSAENLQIYVYGRNVSGGGAPDVAFESTVNLAKGFIYAPQSSMVFKNNADITGAVAAKQVAFKNTLNFTWDPTLASLRARTLSMYYRTAWKECRSERTNLDDPESGCATS